MATDISDTRLESQMIEFQLIWFSMFPTQPELAISCKKSTACLKLQQIKLSRLAIPSVRLI